MLLTGARAELRMLCTPGALLLRAAPAQPLSSHWLSTHNKENGGIIVLPEYDEQNSRIRN